MQAADDRPQDPRRPTPVQRQSDDPAADQFGLALDRMEVVDGRPSSRGRGHGACLLGSSWEAELLIARGVPESVADTGDRVSAVLELHADGKPAYIHNGLSR